MDNETLTKELQRIEQHNERARLFNSPATLTFDEWISTLTHFQWSCAYCTGPYEVLEHFIPLALQGGTSVQNCLPSCTLCNLRKGDTHPGALSWIAPATLLYIRSYFSSLHTGTTLMPPIRPVATVEEHPDAIYTVKDVAEKFQLSQQTVLRFIKSGKLHAVFVHGKWMISKEDIQQLMEAGRRARKKGR